MKKIITLLLLGWLVTFSTTAQVVYNVTPSSSSADPGATIFVDVTVENFVDMIGFQFEMEWNDQVLQFQDITTHGNIMCNVAGNPAVCYTYPSAFGPANITNFFVTQYLDPDFINPTPNTIADGGKLLTMEFLVVGQAGQSSPIDFRGAILAVDSDFNELSVANGMVTANNGTFNVNGTGCAGAGDVTFTASNESGDTGTSGSVKVSVDNFESVEGFGYTMNWDPSIISFTSIGNLNLTGLTNPAQGVGSFGTSQTSSGNLFVSWDNSSGVTACDGDIIFEIFYDIIGAGQTSTDVDFTGNIEVIRNSLLVPHAVNSGSVMVTGNGTGQQTGITFIAEDVTGETGTQVCVPIKVANFDQVISFQYDLTWDPAIVSFATILDGAGQPLSPLGPGNPLGLLNPNPPAIGNFGTTNSSNGVLSLSWDNGGGVTLADQTPIYQVCYDVIGATGETSPINYAGTIEVADVNGLADFTGVPGSVEVIEVFNGGLNLEWDCCEKANPGENICVDVRIVDGFDEILSAQYGMLWDNSVLTFESIAFGNGNPLGLSVGNNLVYDANADAIKLLWFDNSGQGISLGAGTSLYQICFDVTGSVGTNSDLEMGPIPTAIPPFTVEISNNQNTIDFLGNSCNVTVENILPITISETVTNPTCVGDTDGAIDLTISGGVEAYSILWSTTETSEDISGLAAGNYSVTITDCKGVTAEKTITVSDPAPITVTGTIVAVTSAGNDGSIDITANGGSPNYTYLWSTGSTDEDISGLSIGTYTVTVTDANGCTGTESFIVPNACNPITVDVTGSSVTCAGESNGSATANVSGITGTPTYAWSNNLPSQQTVSGLAPGTYFVTVTDPISGCTGSSSIAIEDGATLLVNIVSITDLTCFGVNTGSIEISGFGGTGDFTAVWQPGNLTGLTISNLAAGVYTPVITNINSGCTASGNPITLTQPAAPITVTPTINSASCFGECDGSISLSISGGTAGYTVNWSNGATGTSISDLCAGNYSVTVIDGNGCIFSETYSITQPASLGLSFVVVNESPAGNDGSINLTVSPTGNYSWMWSNGANTEDIFGLVAGIYSVTVTDNDSGCTAVGGGSVMNTLAIQSEMLENATCFGECDGSIEIVISGGQEPYSFVWTDENNVPFAATQNVFDLCAGTYTVTIMDALQIETLTETYVITEPTAVTITNVIIVDESDICDGSINITPGGGQGPYTYQWSYQSLPSQDIFDLCEGTYNVIVSDVNGCTFQSPEYEIEASSPQIGSVDVTDASCFGDCDGKICVNIVGGNAPYMVSINGGNAQQSTATTVCFAGLCPGDFIIEVTDAQGLVAPSITYTIDEPTPIAITNVIITNQSPSVCNGKIDITVSGGTPNYTYEWSNGATNQDPDGLCMGTYGVTITDANGCIFVSPEYTVTKLTEIDVDIISVDCFGASTGAIDLTVTGGFPQFSYLWIQISTGDTISMNQDISNVIAGDYRVIITDGMGVVISDNTLNIGQPASPVSIISSTVIQPTALDCSGGEIEVVAGGGNNGFTFSWENENGTSINDVQVGNTSTITGLSGGMYFLTVTDANDCTTTFQTELDTCQISLDIDLISQLMVSCNGETDGVLAVTASGGTDPYTYDWDTGFSETGIDGSTTENLEPGTYEITATDANGIIVIGSFTILEPAPIQVTINPFQGSAEAIVLGGTPPYTFQWDQVITTDDFIDGLQGGIEHVLLVTDANGCTSELQYFNLDYDAECYEARTVISPNNDGLNDNFYVNCLETTTVKVIIFNRWGQQVYQNDDYDNSFIGIGRRNQVLPQGGYFYVLEYEDGNGVIQTSKGALSIVR